MHCSSRKTEQQLICTCAVYCASQASQANEMTPNRRFQCVYQKYTQISVHAGHVKWSKSECGMPLTRRYALFTEARKQMTSSCYGAAVKLRNSYTPALPAYPRCLSRIFYPQFYCNKNGEIITSYFNQILKVLKK